MSQHLTQTSSSPAIRTLTHQPFKGTVMADSIFTTLLSHAGGIDSLCRGYCQPELAWEENIHADVTPFLEALHDARQIKDQIFGLVMSGSDEAILEVLKEHSQLVKRVIQLNHTFHTAWTLNHETKAAMYLALGLIFDVMKSCEELVQIQVKLASMKLKGYKNVD